MTEALQYDREDDIEAQPEFQQGFTIDTDDKAEWALRKIADHRAETARLVMACDHAIQQYQEKAKRFREQGEQREGYLASLLSNYFDRVPHKSTPTQETYKLPSGTLRLKHQDPEFVREDDKLVKFLEANYPELVKIKKSPDWAEYKKKTTYKSDSEKVYDKDTGELLECVKAVHRASKFQIDI